MSGGETTLSTERLLLEPLLPRHARLLFDGFSDERLYRFIPTDAPESIESLGARYRKLASRSSPDGLEKWLNFAVRLSEDGLQTAPRYTGTLEATVYQDGTASIAYFVFVPFWRNGFATEGCARLLHHLFDEHEVRVVSAEIDTRNSASVALAEALGFERVRITHDADFFKGETSDEYLYKLCSDDFDAMSRR